MRHPQIRPLTVLAVALLLVAGCRSNNAAGAGTERIPDTAPGATNAALPATTTTILTDEQAAYNVYRTFSDASLAIGTDLNRDPGDGSLDATTTPEYRAQIVLNLRGLKLNGIRLQGQDVTRLLSSRMEGNKAKLKVCVRDDIDQIDRTGKQLTPPGPGTPVVWDIGLLRQGSNWLMDAALKAGDPCDV